MAIKLEALQRFIMEKEIFSALQRLTLAGMWYQRQTGWQEGPEAGGKSVNGP